jgi:hypothetical protein
MQNASLSATANERHEISLLSRTKLRAKMELLLKLMSKASYVQLAQEISWRLGASISRRSGPYLFQQTVWPIERQVCTEGASQD